MDRIGHISLMAQYNEWMNSKLYDAATALPEEALIIQRGAFFGSILGTLNHLIVGDTLWLKRFADHPAGYPELEVVRNLPHPKSLDQILYTDTDDLSAHRNLLDRTISEWTKSISSQQLDHVLHYTNIKGIAARKNFFSLIIHFFNHQTHHRGQITTLLSQAKVDIGETDLLALIPNETEL